MIQAEAGEACLVCGKPSERPVSHWECERQLLDTQGKGAAK